MVISSGGTSGWVDGIPGTMELLVYGNSLWCQRHSKYIDMVPTQVTVIDRDGQHKYTVCAQCFYEEIPLEDRKFAREQGHFTAHNEHVDDETVCAFDNCFKDVHDLCSACGKHYCFDHMEFQSLCELCFEEKCKTIGETGGY